MKRLFRWNRLWRQGFGVCFWIAMFYFSWQTSPSSVSRAVLVASGLTLFATLLHLGGNLLGIRREMRRGDAKSYDLLLVYRYFRAVWLVPIIAPVLYWLLQPWKERVLKVALYLRIRELLKDAGRSAWQGDGQEAVTYLVQACNLERANPSAASTFGAHMSSVCTSLQQALAARATEKMNEWLRLAATAILLKEFEYTGALPHDPLLVLPEGFNKEDVSLCADNFDELLVSDAELSARWLRKHVESLEVSLSLLPDDVTRVLEKLCREFAVDPDLLDPFWQQVARYE